MLEAVKESMATLQEVCTRRPTFPAVRSIPTTLPEAAQLTRTLVEAYKVTRKADTQNTSLLTICVDLLSQLAGACSRAESNVECSTAQMSAVRVANSRLQNWLKTGVLVVSSTTTERHATTHPAPLPVAAAPAKAATPVAEVHATASAAARVAPSVGARVASEEHVSNVDGMTAQEKDALYLARNAFKVVRQVNSLFSTPLASTFKCYKLSEALNIVSELQGTVKEYMADPSRLPATVPVQVMDVVHNMLPQLASALRRAVDGTVPGLPQATTVMNYAQRVQEWLQSGTLRQSMVNGGGVLLEGATPPIPAALCVPLGPFYSSEAAAAPHAKTAAHPTTAAAAVAPAAAAAAAAAVSADDADAPAHVAQMMKLGVLTNEALALVKAHYPVIAPLPLSHGLDTLLDASQALQAKARALIASLRESKDKNLGVMETVMHLLSQFSGAARRVASGANVAAPQDHAVRVYVKRIHDWAAESPTSTASLPLS
ncbi:MAG: hypothetical protein EOO41_03675, partial [Methanobacteriota archaeon]